MRQSRHHVQPRITVDYVRSVPDSVAALFADGKYAMVLLGHGDTTMSHSSNYYCCTLINFIRHCLLAL